nr:MAG TPA: head tail adaptor [Caudoviricetes sp.]
MSEIGGNTKAVIQVRTSVKNAIGASETTWKDAETLEGWLDLSGGESRYNSYNTKIQQSTHIFLADYRELGKKIKAENSRVVIDNELYDVMLIDDPMNLHKQLEIFLKFTGG